MPETWQAETIAVLSVIRNEIEAQLSHERSVQHAAEATIAQLSFQLAAINNSIDAIMGTIEQPPPVDPPSPPPPPEPEPEPSPPPPPEPPVEPSPPPPPEPETPPVEPPPPDPDDEEPELPPVDPTPLPHPPLPQPGAAVRGLHAICPITGKRADGTWGDAKALVLGYEAFYQRRSTWFVGYPGIERPENLLPGKGKIPPGFLRWCAGRGMVYAPRTPIAFKDHETGQPAGTSLRRAARGDYDDIWRAHAQDMVDNGHGDAIIGLAWEADLSGSWPWSLNRDYYGPGDGRNFKTVMAAIRRAVGVYLSVSMLFRFDWTHFREPHVIHAGRRIWIHPDEWYPGDDFVTFIGCDLYDGQNNYTDDNANRLMARVEPSPQPGRGPIPAGGDSWFLYAKGKGKPFIVPEWGIRCREPDLAAGDRSGAPFVRAMRRRIDGPWKADLAGENYFERNREHRLVPQTRAGTDVSTQAMKAALRG